MLSEHPRPVLEHTGLPNAPPIRERVHPTQTSVVEMEGDERRRAEILAVKVFDLRIKDITRTATKEDYEALEGSVKDLKSLIDLPGDISRIIFKTPVFPFFKYRMNVEINTGVVASSDTRTQVVSLIPGNKLAEIQSQTQRIFTSSPPLHLPHL